MDNKVCNQCKRGGIKLWRKHQQLGDLVCITCDTSPDELKQEIREGWTDQLEHRVPYVPTGDGGAWGYTSVPDNLVTTWKLLPF